MGDPVSKLLPYGLGGVALLAVVVFLLNAFFGELSKNLAGRTPDAVMGLLRRRRRVGGRQLRRYRAGVIERHRRHQLGLIEDDSVDIRHVYVPLRCADTGEELAPAVRAASRCVVLGAPGAGKSLLLKSAILDWASGEGDDQGIPVLLDLHRCNGSDASFEDMIAEQFARGQVKNPAQYARNALETGQLRIFFDGLDEVAPGELPAVVERLKEFGLLHPDCPMTVTCRTSAWTGQLTPEFPSVLRVADFDDPSIRLFLRRWHELGPASRLTGVDQVLSALRGNPELMRLARSPLMLTIIAWLQSETRAEDVGPLPHSRAAFYRLAVEHLLDRDRRLSRAAALSRYKPQRKLMALQRIALTLQETYDTRSDRLVIDRTALDGVLTEVLPNCNLSEADRDPFFEEILQRSQLMIAVDSIGNHFSFPHLTLQEFLAAQALHDRPDRLVRNYRADPAGWRETVKMWCAVASVPCTGVVRALWEDGGSEGRALALACLGDAAYVNADLAELIVTGCLEELVTSGSPTVRSGLASLAATPGPRGDRVYRELVALVERPPHEAAHGPAALALAGSGLPQAAGVLARAVTEHGTDQLFEAVHSMGEVAVPALGREAAAGGVWAVDLLAELAEGGAREAVKPLVGTLSYGGVAPQRAAWWLASLIDDPEVEQEIDAFPVPDGPVWEDGSLDWIWAPFAGTPPSSAPRVVGRMVRLMGVAPLGVAPLGVAPRSGVQLPHPSAGSTRVASAVVGSVSARIALPVIGADVWEAVTTEPYETRAARRRELEELSQARRELQRRLTGARRGGHFPDDDFNALRTATLTRFEDSFATRHRLLLDRLPVLAQVWILILLYVPYPHTFRNAWTSSTDPLPSDPKRISLVARMVFVLGVVLPLGIAGVLSGLATVGHAPDLPWSPSPWGPEWWAWGAGVSLALGAGLYVCSQAALFPLTPTNLWFIVEEFGPWLVSVLGLVYVGLAGASALGDEASWWVLLGWLLAVGAAGQTLRRLAGRRLVARSNPYRHCLAAAGFLPDST